MRSQRSSITAVLSLDSQRISRSREYSESWAHPSPFPIHVSHEYPVSTAPACLRSGALWRRLRNRLLGTLGIGLHDRPGFNMSHTIKSVVRSEDPCASLKLSIKPCLTLLQSQPLSTDAANTSPHTPMSNTIEHRLRVEAHQLAQLLVFHLLAADPASDGTFIISTLLEQPQLETTSELPLYSRYPRLFSRVMLS